MHDILISEIFNQNINLFYLINLGMDNSILDVIMTFITDFGSVIAWGLFCVLLFVFGGEKAKKVALLGLLALFITNLAVGFLKNMVAEPRPFMTLPNAELLVPERGSYSFPSSHTASSFAAATVIGLKYRFKIRKRSQLLIYPLIAFAGIIAFSRIYIGVHYPLDVLVGAIIGIICALTVLKYENQILNNKITSFFHLNKIMEFNIAQKIKNQIYKAN